MENVCVRESIAVIEDLRKLIIFHQWQTAFENALHKVNHYKLEGMPELYTLDDYYDWLATFLKWIPHENSRGREIYDHLCRFYLILDQPSLRILQSPQSLESINGAQLPLSPLSQWMVDFSKQIGTFLDDPASLSAASLQSFYASPTYHMDDYEPGQKGWKTFNQFFSRKTKFGARPITSPQDHTVVVSPADSTFVGWWPVNEMSQIMVKNLTWSLTQLLAGSPYQDAFKGGIFLHSFLNTSDYHRLHTPTCGKVLEARTILGQVYMDVVAVPRDSNKLTNTSYQLEVIDGTGYQFSQARGLLVLNSPVGLVAVIPVGMAHVSSIVMTVHAGEDLSKGDEFAYFQFGGSDVVMLFEKKANLNLIAQPHTHCRQGEWIGNALEI